jgi:Domain of unknown function (DUF4157)
MQRASQHAAREHSLRHDTHEREADVAASALRPGAARPALSPIGRLAGQQAQALPPGRGQAIPADVRSDMQSRLGHDFSNVRVHVDGSAAQSADSLDARAYTQGHHVVFGSGEYQPRSGAGRELLAHELAHVVQQRGQLPRVQRQPKQKKPAAKPAAAAKEEAPIPKGPEGLVVNIVIRAPDDRYTSDAAQYMQDTLGETVYVVDNIAQGQVKAIELAKAGKQKVAKIRMVGHGAANGQLSMTPEGEKDRKWIGAADLEKMGADKAAAMAEVMAEGAEVELWACNVGRSEETTKAVSKALGGEVSATGGTVAVRRSRFARSPSNGETAENADGTINAVSTSEIDFRVSKGDKALGASFNQWLLAQGAALEANGDIPPEPDKDKQIARMRNLFDRSGGQIKTLVVKVSATTGVERREKKAWAQQWKKTKAK